MVWSTLVLIAAASRHPASGRERYCHSFLGQALRKPCSASSSEGARGAVPLGMVPPAAEGRDDLPQAGARGEANAWSLGTLRTSGSASGFEGEACQTDIVIGSGVIAVSCCGDSRDVIHVGAKP